MVELPLDYTTVVDFYACEFNINMQSINTFHTDVHLNSKINFETASVRILCFSYKFYV